MRKEELIDLMQFENSVETSQAHWLLTKFFQENVVTLKGINRHPYADVIHAYAEGINNIEVLRSEGWVEFKQSGMCLCIGDEYRIKPSEPVYEWQWYYYEDGTAHIFCTPYQEYFTENEVEDFYKKFEETKRIRK